MPDQSESARLRALRAAGLLSGEGRREFEHQIALVREAVGVPVALVTLIDRDRQVFAAQLGLSEPWASAGETPLTHSFCKHVVRQRAPLIVADAYQEPLVSDNLAIADLDVRAYLGVPLALPDGQVVGALAAIAPQPRAWSPHDLKLMQLTARVVADEIATRVAEAEWRTLFDELQEGFILGEVVRDGAGRVADWRYKRVNRAWGELVGIASHQATGRTIRELFPGIEDEWVNEFADVVATGQPIRFTRQVGALGRWYDGVAQPIGSDTFVVLFMEVTERVLAEAKRNALVDLGDVLLRTEEPDAVTHAACEIIGRALGAGRVGYGTVLADGETFTVPNDWVRDGFPTLAGTYRMDDYGLYAEDLREGRTVVIPDIRLDPRTAPDTAPLERVSVRTLINHPVVENGRTVAVLYINDDTPRVWTAAELAFVQDAAARTRSAFERRRAEFRLRRGEERQRIAIAAGEIGVFELNLKTGELLCDNRVRAALGVTSGRPISQADKVAAVHPDDRPAFDAALQAALEGELLDARFRTVGLDDRLVRWVAVQARVLTDGSDVRRMIGALRDVTEAVWVELRRDALVELGDRLREVETVEQAAFAAADVIARVLGATRAGYGSVDAGQEIVNIHADWCAPGVASVAGRHRFRDFGTYIEDLKRGEPVIIADVAEDSRTEAGSAALRALDITALVNLPIMSHGRLEGVALVHANTAKPFSREDVAFVSAVADRTQAVVAKLRAQSEQQLLNQEISHRLKNSLALVQAVANQTLRGVTERAPVEAFEQRLHALSSAHDILLRSNWTTAPMASVIGSTLETLGQAARVFIAGPAVQLGSRAALSLALLVHELATNAMKYGALSNDNGKVSVSWETRGDRLEFRWRESGGPEVAQPRGKGFGSRMVRMGLTGGGGVDMHFDPTGLEVRMTASVDQLQSA